MQHHTEAGRAEPSFAYERSCLHELIERSAHETPHATAIVCGTAQLSYEQLNARANQLSRFLTSRNVTRGSIVAMCVQRSIDAVALLIAIVKTGATFVPLDPNHPRERLAWTIADLSPELVIADDALLDLVTSDDRPKPLALAAIATASLAFASTNRAGDVRPGDLAYIIFTSGSSGRPKGVMIEHASATNMLLSARTDVHLTAADRVLFLAPFSFDPSIWQTFGTLAAGACIVVAPPNAERDPATLARVIVRDAVSVFIAVPAIISGVLDAGITATTSTVRTVVSGGSVLLPSLRTRLRAAGFDVYNVYGPTEGSIHTTTHHCSDADPAGFVPLGAPVAHTNVSVVGENFERVVPGAEGEIVLGGAGLARGYLHRDDLTAERFIVSSATTGSSERLYRTGDRARLHADGSIEFLGRLDEQIKILGVRIELAEVEAVLGRHPRVLAAVVLPNPDIRDRLVAYVVADTPPGEAIADLLMHARAALAPQAVPTQFVFLDAMPQLANGKIDRQALALWPVAPAPPALEARPADSLAALVSASWQTVLGREAIGIHDDFFQIGGNSMLAARVVTLVEERTRRRLRLDRFFAQPTIDAMVRSLREDERVRYESFVTLSDAGTRTPLFYLHGDSSGLGLYCRKFGETLGRERPVYALAPHGSDGGPVPDTVEAMAADCIAKIRAHQAHGPYLIGGYCIGSIVAFEVARQLEAAGDTIAHLILIEAQGARPRFGYIEDALAALTRSAGIRPDRFRAWSARQRTVLRRVFRVMRRMCGIAEPPGGLPIDARADEANAAQHRAVLGYVWRPIDAPTTMLCARDEAPDLDIVRKNWTNVVGSLTIERVSGNHQSAIGPHIDEVLDAIGAAIERAAV